MADSIAHVQGGWKDVSVIPSSYNMSHFLYRQLSISFQNLFPMRNLASSGSLKACRNGRKGPGLGKVA